jgi:transposase
VLEVTAGSEVNLLYIHPNSAALFYTKTRQIITYNLAIEAKEIFNCEIEINESYFGSVRKGKRGRGAGGKTIIYGMFKRQDKVYTVVFENTKTSTLMAKIARKIRPDSVVYTDYYHRFDALDVSEFHHYRIDHSDKIAEEKTI